MPENYLPPAHIRERWVSGETSIVEQSGKIAAVQPWIYLTYIRLSKVGFPVELCHEIPKEGFVISLTGNLAADYRPPQGVFLTGVVADGMPHPACHFHILQNATHAQRLSHSAYIPFWPQPGLIPRAAERGETFENIFFYGDPPNLAPELQQSSFRNLLKSRVGMNFELRELKRWHDYSDADCALAIRQFGSRPFLRKPSTKLYNAWMAGVPMIGGFDSSFRADGKAGINYIACKSLEEVLNALERLREDLSFRRNLIAQGKLEALSFTSEAITHRWVELLQRLTTREAPTHFSRSSVASRLFAASQQISVTVDGLCGGF